MAPARRSYAGLTAAALAVAAAAALAAYPALTASTGGPLLAAIGGTAVLLTAVALVLRVGGLLPLPIVLLLAEYAVALALDADAAPAAPVMAAALVVLAELAYWGAEPRGVGRSAGLAARRAVLVAGLAGAAAGLSAFLLGASEIARGGGVLLPAIGVAAAVGVLAVLAVLARMRPG